MQTHIKEAFSTVIAFAAIIGTVHAGIWFKLFGVPDVTILNWPFHYFWFVVGAVVSLLVIFWAYHWYATKLEGEKERLHANYEGRTKTDAETRSTGSDTITGGDANTPGPDGSGGD